MLLLRCVFLREFALIGSYFREIALIGALGGKTASHPSLTYYGSEKSPSLLVEGEGNWKPRAAPFTT